MEAHYSRVHALRRERSVLEVYLAYRNVGQKPVELITVTRFEEYINDAGDEFRGKTATRWGTSTSRVGEDDDLRCDKTLPAAVSQKKGVPHF